MLLEGHRLRRDGFDVVGGYLNTHEREEMAPLLRGLELIPCRKTEFHGVTLEEMDVDAILERKPYVVLIDELAHVNVPDSKNPRRYQDVAMLLEAGIHAISTMNIQHLESLCEAVEAMTGESVYDRISDSVIAS